MFVAVASSVGRCDAAAASDAVSIRVAVTVETADKFCVFCQRVLIVVHWTADTFVSNAVSVH